jgi:hypothetical protein
MNELERLTARWAEDVNPGKELVTHESFDSLAKFTNATLSERAR